MHSVDQTKSAHGVSDTLMLGSRKKTVAGKPVRVTVLYSRSGHETLWERLKLFLFGNVLEERAKQKIVECLKKNPAYIKAAADFLTVIKNANTGVSASKLIETIVLAKLKGVDLLNGIEVTHLAETSNNAEEISKDYLMKRAGCLSKFGASQESIKTLAELLLNFGQQPSVEKMEKLLFEPRKAQAARLEQDQIHNLLTFKNILLSESPPSVISTNLVDHISLLLGENDQSTQPWDPKMIVGAKSEPSGNPFVDVSLT